MSFDEFDQLKGIERLLKKMITRKEMDSFIPSTPLPESVLDTRPIKAKKPKKPGHKTLNRTTGPRSEESSEPRKPRRRIYNSNSASASAPKPKRKRPLRRRKKKVSGSIRRTT